MKEILNSYKNYIKIKNKVKLNTRLEQLKKKLLISNNTEISKRFTLYDLEQLKKKTRKSVIQNEISSISKLMSDKIICFTTNTINSNINVDVNFPKNVDVNSQYNHLENKLFKQYNEFKKFNNTLRTYSYTNTDNKKERIDYKTLRVFELTKKFNLHQHRIDLLNNFTDFTEYLKSIIYKRNSTNIGRTEIRVDVSILNQVLNTEIIIRVNNKNEKLEYVKTYDEKTKRDFYIVKNSIKNNGNYIYLKPVIDLANDKEHLTKYLFKYLLKASNEDSIENIVFSKIGIRQKQYSHKFFCDLEKTKLEKISTIIYREAKRKNFLLEDKELDINTILYDTSRMIINEDLKIEDKTIYIKHNNEYKILSTMLSYDKVEYEGFYGEYKRLEDKKYINDTLTINEEITLENKQKLEKYENLYYREKLFEELCLFNEIKSKEYDLRQDFRENHKFILKNRFKDKLLTEEEIIKKINTEKEKQTRTNEKDRVEKEIYKYYEKMEDKIFNHYKEEKRSYKKNKSIKSKSKIKNKKYNINIKNVLSSTPDYRIELYDKF